MRNTQPIFSLVRTMKLAIETGRYSNKSDDIRKADQLCKLCMTPDSSTHIIEDEVHFTKICPSYNHLRENFSSELSHKITNEEFNSIFESSALANEISKFIFQYFST